MVTAQKIPNSECLTDIDGAKQLLAVGGTTIYKFCNEGKLTPIKFGRRCTRFRISEIQALIATYEARSNSKV